METAVILRICHMLDCSMPETNRDRSFFDNHVNGTLRIPDQFESGTVALAIQGLGSTDHNGNNPSITNNSLKMLAKSSAYHDFASLKYDNIGIANSQVPNLKESDMSLDQFIADTQG